MKKGIFTTISFSVILAVQFIVFSAKGQAVCDVVSVVPDPDMHVEWSPDSSQYLINKKDTGGIYQIYVGNAGDTNTVCISLTGPFALIRQWNVRHKMQVHWHPTENFIVCGVEKEWYFELFLNGTPEGKKLLEGWLQSGLWMDIFAVTPNGSNWYGLVYTEAGFTGPAFTPDGTKAAWAEARDSSNLAVDVFGKWDLMLADFVVNSGVPSFTNVTNINPAGSRWIEPGNFGPDGKSLLVSSDIGMINAEGQDQFIIDITNGNVTNLNNTPKVWDEHGIFSSDGKKIVFMSSYPYQADTNSYHTISIKAEFMLMNADGSGLQQLTHFCDTNYYPVHPGIAAVGFFNHEGTAIYGTSLVFPDYNYWIINFAGNCGNDALSSVSDEISGAGIFIYPNPASSELNIVSDNVSQGTYNVEILNVLGQVEYQRLFNTSAMGNINITLPVNDLIPGLYTVNIKGDKSITTRKLLKQ